MAFTPVFLEELSARNPIEDLVGHYVALTRRGSNLFGLCPFHSEKTPSFSVSPDKNIYYCFGCHKGGGPVNFIMEAENLDFPDAVRFLAKRAGIELPEDETHQSSYRRQERLRVLMKEAARYYHCQLFTPYGEAGRAYLQKRGLSKTVVTRFGLGYAPDGWSCLMDTMKKKGYTIEEMQEAGLVLKSQKGSFYDRFRNRLMFPIIDLKNNIIGFGGRVLDDSKPKYLNSPETVLFNKRKNLFALNLARKSSFGQIILTEGYLDAITLHQYGFDCAVASLGTALTPEHARLLAKYTDRVVLTYDGDEAGQNATRRGIPILEKAGLQVRILRMQGAKDPDEYLKKYGADRFKLLLEQSENQAEYRLSSLQSQYDLSLDDQRIAFLREAAELISTFSSSVSREIYGARTAAAADITPETMQHEISRAYKRRKQKEREAQERADLNVRAQIQPKNKGIVYSNPRSARAEEQIIIQAIKDPDILTAVQLAPEQFSSPFLGRVFGFFQTLHQQGSPVSLASLQGTFSPDELSHLSALTESDQNLVSEQAVQDCAAVIRGEFEKTLHSGEDALNALYSRIKEKKQYGG